MSRPSSRNSRTQQQPYYQQQQQRYPPAEAFFVDGEGAPHNMAQGSGPEFETARNKRPAEVARFLRMFEISDRLEVSNALLSIGLHHYQQISGGPANLAQLQHTASQIRRLPAFRYNNASNQPANDRGRNSARSSSAPSRERRSPSSGSIGTSSLRQFIHEERVRRRQERGEEGNDGHHSPKVTVFRPEDGRVREEITKDDSPPAAEATTAQPYTVTMGQRAQQQYQFQQQQQQPHSPQRRSVDTQDGNESLPSPMNSQGTRVPLGSEGLATPINSVSAGSPRSSRAFSGTLTNPSSRRSSDLPDDQANTVPPNAVMSSDSGGSGTTSGGRGPGSETVWTVSSQSAQSITSGVSNASRPTAIDQVVAANEEVAIQACSQDAPFVPFPVSFVDDLASVVQGMDGQKAPRLMLAARMQPQHASLVQRNGFAGLYRSLLVNYHLSAPVEM